MANYNILTEVPPISKQDSFVVFERRKSNFNFPIHIHSEYELNYIIGARGARRIVGDHVADIGDREMVLITGSNLEHAWMDGNLAPGAEIYEVTIQFSPELFQGSGLIDRKQFAPIKKMLQDAPMRRRISTMRWTPTAVCSKSPARSAVTSLLRMPKAWTTKAPVW